MTAKNGNTIADGDITELTEQMPLKATDGEWDNLQKNEV